MKIASLTAYHVKIPLRRKIRHASHQRQDTDNVVVKCVLENGIEGYGEGVPRDYVTGETIDTAMELLGRSDLGSQIRECSDFPEAVKWAENLSLAPVAGDIRECQGNAARCALELAVLDAWGKHFRIGIHELVPMLAPGLAKALSPVRYSGAVTSARGWKLVFLALALRIYWFRQIKVKVGIAGQDDAGRLRTIRKLVRKKVDLRIDANEAWDISEAADRIRQLADFRISSIEQPVPHGQVDGLASLRKAIQIPVMLDESLCSMVDARNAVRDQTCDLFNLRLSKCGGFIRTLRIAEFAHQNGLGYQLGCQVGETAILSAAGRHFASRVGGIRFYEGSYDSHLVKEALGKKDITFGWGGWAKPLEGPGLGIEIDPVALERVKIREARLF